MKILSIDPTNAVGIASSSELYDAGKYPGGAVVNVKCLTDEATSLLSGTGVPSILAIGAYDENSTYRVVIGVDRLAGFYVCCSRDDEPIRLVYTASGSSVSTDPQLLVAFTVGGSDFSVTELTRYNILPLVTHNGETKYLCVEFTRLVDAHIQFIVAGNYPGQSWPSYVISDQSVNLLEIGSAFDNGSATARAAYAMAGRAVEMSEGTAAFLDSQGDRTYVAL